MVSFKPRFRIPVLTASLLLLAHAPASLAAWQEGDSQILTLDEAVSRLASFGVPAPASTVPGDTPIVIAEGADLDDPKTLAAALVQSGLTLRAGSGGGVIEATDRFDEGIRVGDRQYPVIEVRSGTDAGGIESGAVYAFGRPLSTPFVVDSDDASVTVNGVVVFPSPGARVLPPAATPAQAEAHTKIDAAFSAFGLNRYADENSARDAFRRAILDIDGYERAEWVETTLVVTGSNGITELFPTDGSREAEDVSPEATATYFAGHADALTQALRDDYTVIAGATYFIAHVNDDAATFASRVNDIRASAETVALRLARLQARIGHREAAADLLFTN